MTSHFHATGSMARQYSADLVYLEVIYYGLSNSAVYFWWSEWSSKSFTVL